MTAFKTAIGGILALCMTSGAALAAQTGGSGSPGFLVDWGLVPAEQADPVAHTGYWQYGDWHVAVDEVDSYEDGTYYSCTAWTGGDGEPRVSVSISALDVGPPTAYPGVVVEEFAPRGYNTFMQDGQSAYVWFEDEDTIDSEVISYYDDDGILHADLPFYSPTSQWVLQAMRRNGQMDVVVEGQVFTTFWLNGFTASYLKMMEGCGFTGVGVVN